MHTRRGGRVLATGPLLASLFALGGCFQPTGPIVGDWRGVHPGLDPFNSETTELILDGPPGATSGTYHLVNRSENTDLSAHEDQNLRWADRWEKRREVDAAGQGYDTIHLFRTPGTQIADYVPTANGALVPLSNPLHPDLSANAMRIALYPLPRTTYGYGRP